MLGGHKIRLIKENPHVPLNKLMQMRKENLLAAIHSADVLEAGMDLDKHTLIVWLNYELCRDVGMPDIPITFNYRQEKP